MESEDEGSIDYAGEIDEKRHQKLVENVVYLHKAQPAKKPPKTEPKLKFSELDVATLPTEKHDTKAILVNKVLKKRKSETSNKKNKKNADTFADKSEALSKPLEKPQAERVRRAVAYEKNKLKLDKWEPIVTSNRVAAHITFPLDHNPKIEIKESKELTKTWRLKSELQQDLEKIDPPKVEVYEMKEKDQMPKTIRAMLEHRKEMAKMRALQSYKEAKARRQSKIKSKKYHRIQRRQKIKHELKEFEQLQKTNPEEALKKLEDIDRIRAEERFSLRHRSTSKWAKNKQIRAKYDKESRQMLSQQLKLSRDLTQKTSKLDDDSDDASLEDDANLENDTSINPYETDPNNPWAVKPKKEVAEYLASYKKFWNEKNKELKESHDMQEVRSKKEHVEENVINADLDVGKMELSTQDTKEILEKGNIENNIIDLSQSSESSKKKNIKKRKAEAEDMLKNSVAKSKKKKKKNDTSSDSTKVTSNGWEVSSLDVEDIFQRLEDKLASKIKRKAKRIEKHLENSKKEPSTKTPKKTTNKIDLSLPRQIKKPIIDEKLGESIDDLDTEDTKESDMPENERIRVIKEILLEEPTVVKQYATNKKGKDKGLSNIINPKTTELSTAIPDILTKDEEDESNEYSAHIMDAFEDDDAVTDFTKEKKETIDKNRPKDIDLSLPGWGAWGGTGIKMSNRKRRRFIIKMPKNVPRRDDNKGTLIINENADSKIKNLMVSEVPFPFTSVKDYEASLRAPIGRTFVPERAFRKLIKPAVQTKIGTIIEPMSRDVLLSR